MKGNGNLSPGKSYLAIHIFFSSFCRFNFHFNEQAVHFTPCLNDFPKDFYNVVDLPIFSDIASKKQRKKFSLVNPKMANKIPYRVEVIDQQNCGIFLLFKEKEFQLLWRIARQYIENVPRGLNLTFIGGTRKSGII